MWVCACCLDLWYLTSCLPVPCLAQSRLFAGVCLLRSLSQGMLDIRKFDNVCPMYKWQESLRPRSVSKVLIFDNDLFPSSEPWIIFLEVAKAAGGVCPTEVFSQVFHIFQWAPLSPGKRVAQEPLWSSRTLRTKYITAKTVRAKCTCQKCISQRK